VVGEFCDHGHLVAGSNQAPGYLVSPGLGGTDFGGEVLGEVEDSHL
jgi:hypothetical protein